MEHLVEFQEIELKIGILARKHFQHAHAEREYISHAQRG
jgi:hypothetical protein